MKLRLVRELDVFDLVHSHYKNPRTLVSLRLDGREYFSLEFPGIKIISPGKNVVVAFQDNKEKRVVAWLDPISKEFLLVNGWPIGLFLIPGIFTALLATKLISIAGLSIWLPAVVGIVVFMLVLCAAIQSHLSRRNLETLLRKGSVTNDF